MKPRLSSSPQKQLKTWQDFVRQWSGPELVLDELFATPFAIEQIQNRNCENLLGSVSIPLGVAGPVRIKSRDLNEEVLVPLATTEGALVASVNRGCKALNLAGGVKVMVKKIGMSRAPVFVCSDSAAAMEFIGWLATSFPRWQKLCTQTSRHLKLTSQQNWLRGRYVFVRFVFDTDEAMGMNMVTVALTAAWEKLKTQQLLVKMLAVSSNVCVDKKDSHLNRLLGRGYWVQAEAELSRNLIRTILKVDDQELVQLHQVKNLIGSNLAGSFSQNMQVANVAAALFAATGQDLAHVVEASQGNLILEHSPAGVYASLTLPNLNLGTVGGGTHLPAQTQARSIITRSGQLKAGQLAAVVASASLAAELSGLAALASGNLAAAHQRLGRGQNHD